MKTEIKAFVESHPELVSRKQTSDPDLFVLKYKNRVFYDNLWNDYLEQCRGTIVDSEYNVVSLPLTKIYNYGIESRAPRIAGDTMVTAYRKINGFMAAITWHNDRLLVSTTGSIDSIYVGYATELIDRNRPVYEAHLKSFPNHTFIFECVHRDDPHIIPESEGMYLLTMRLKDWDSPIEYDPNIIAEHSAALQLQPIECIRCKFDDVRSVVKSVNHEGFVIYTADGISTKIKSPYYLTKKFFARCNKTDKLLSKTVKEKFDEEYYPLIEYIQSNVDAFIELEEQDRLNFIREYLNGQN